MKWLLTVAGLLLASAVPAQAQIGNIVGGGGGIGKVVFPSLPNNPPTQFNAVVVSGNAQDFVPTSYASYEQAIAQGRAALALKAKSVVEVAQENNSAAKPKAKLVLVQDAGGNAIIERR